MITKTPKIKKARVKKGKVKATWNKIKKNKKTKALRKKIKRIQVQYSTNFTFKTNVKNKKLAKNRTTTTLKLKRKTRYFMRIRYVGSDGVSKWSKVQRVKTK